MNYKALLFDLDGVVFDTENSYTDFWAAEGLRYHPERPNFAQEIKGSTLSEILQNQLGGFSSEHQDIVDRLNSFEESMTFEYILGFELFVSKAKENGLKTAIVTSSTALKMQQVFKQHSELLQLIDLIVTADDITEGKPSPECYLRAAEKLDVDISECVVFEDSINGLMAANNANMKAVALTTTVSRDRLKTFSDFLIDNFTDERVQLFIQ